MYKIEITASAQSELREIFRYVAEELEATPSAVKLISGIKAKIIGLSSMPYYKVSDYFPGYHMVHYRKFNILFRIDEEKKTVYVAHIVYAGRGKLG